MEACSSGEKYGNPGKCIGSKVLLIFVFLTLHLHFFKSDLTSLERDLILYHAVLLPLVPQLVTESSVRVMDLCTCGKCPQELNLAFCIILEVSYFSVFA